MFGKRQESIAGNNSSSENNQPRSISLPPLLFGQEILRPGKDKITCRRIGRNYDNLISVFISSFLQ